MPSDLEDRELAARASAGDRDALERILASVRPHVRSYCRVRLNSYPGGSELAEDATQETLLGLALAIPGHRADGAPLGALLWRIAANKVVDAQRRHARRFEHETGTVIQHGPGSKGDTWEKDVEPYDRAPSPERLAIIRSDLAVALELVRRLPERSGRIVLLRAEGYSPAEVGELVGATANAVRVLHHRALRMLAQMLEVEVVDLT